MAFPSNLVPDFDLMVAAARVDGFSRAFGIGYNPSIDTASVPESCWGGAGPYPWLPALTALEVVAPGSTQDVGDTGTGAWTVIVQGLDAAWNPVTITVQLNGATPVPIGSFFRVNAFRVTRSGSTRKNSVDIIIRDAGGGTTRAVILAGKSVARQAAFTPPTGFTLFVDEILLVVDKATGSVTRDASLETYFAPPPPAPAILPLPIGNSSVGPYNHVIHPPISVAQQTDFDLPIWRVSDNASIITAAWNGVLKRNTL